MRGLILGRSRRRIVKDFVAARATSADRAIPYVANDARIFRQLRVYGAIVDDGAGRYYLDARKLGAFRASVRLRAAAIVGFSGVAVSVAAAATVFALAE